METLSLHTLLLSAGRSRCLGLGGFGSMLENHLWTNGEQRNAWQLAVCGYLIPAKCGNEVVSYSRLSMQMETSSK